MSVGIDIGSKTVKIVDLVPEGNSWRLKSSGILGYTGNMPEEAKDDKELVPLADAIRKLHKEAKVSSKEVCIAIPEVHVYCKTIKFPLLTDSEVTSAVRWEAEQYVPIPVKDAVIQHKIIERREDVVPGRVVVLLVAVPRALVQKYVKVVETEQRLNEAKQRHKKEVTDRISEAKKLLADKKIDEAVALIKEVA
ncbi:MAG: pilus assembly protein PilM, partial [Patescibacteria group bacterium]|nr:pilus assembly protein PilM [Patescibacteria group bacterium]